MPLFFRPPFGSSFQHAVRTAVALGACLVFAVSGRGADPQPPTDELLKLVPAEAGSVLALDELRDHWRRIVDSSLAQSFRTLPTFQTWTVSKNAAEFVHARDELARFLNASAEEIRDDILGDAVVLAIIPPEDRSVLPSKARGLLVLKARNPALLTRLIDRVNEAQKTNGELAEVVENRHRDVVYQTRTYPKNSQRPTESYVLFPDGVFAASNDSALILDVIDRKGGGKPGRSFAEAEGFAGTSRTLAPRSLARVFLSGDFLSRILDALPPEQDPNRQRILKAFQSYLGTLNVAAAGVVVEDGRVQLQIVQGFRSGTLTRDDAWLPGLFPLADAPTRLTAPASAVAVASIHVDLPKLYGALASLVPAKDQKKLPKLEAIAASLLMGRSLREQILPALGPEVTAHIDAADLPGGPPFRFTASIAIREEDRAETAAALQNALTAGMTVLSLDESRIPSSADVVSRQGVTSLSIPYPFAFAVDPIRGRLTLGNAAIAVTRSLEADAQDEQGARFHEFQAAAFMDSPAFACVDLTKLVGLATKNRALLVDLAARRQSRRINEVERDFDQILDVARLFDAAYASGRVDVSEDQVEHRIGLLPRPASETPAP